jgi:hypothetical protein
MSTLGLQRDSHHVDDKIAISDELRDLIRLLSEATVEFKTARDDFDGLRND